MLPSYISTLDKTLIASRIEEASLAEFLRDLFLRSDGFIKKYRRRVVIDLVFTLTTLYRNSTTMFCNFFESFSGQEQAELENSEVVKFFRFMCNLYTVLSLGGYK